MQSFRCWSLATPRPHLTRQRLVPLAGSFSFRPSHRNETPRRRRRAGPNAGILDRRTHRPAKAGSTRSRARRGELDIEPVSSA